jgi:hypothetical protein
MDLDTAMNISTAGPSMRLNEGSTKPGMIEGNPHAPFGLKRLGSSIHEEKSLAAEMKPHAICHNKRKIVGTGLGRACSRSSAIVKPGECKLRDKTRREPGRDGFSESFLNVHVGERDS